MFPKKTKEYYTEIADEQSVSEKDVQEVLHSFWQSFVPGEIRKIDKPGFLIYKFGKFFTSLKDSIRRVKRIQKLLDTNDEREKPLSEEVIDNYEKDLENLKKNIKYYEKKFNKRYLEE